MNMDVRQYLEQITPLNILGVLDPSVLDNLLNGYCYALNSGITLIYPIALPITQNNLERRDAFGLSFRHTFCPLCAYWRDPAGCDNEEYCIDVDKTVTIKYWNSPGLKLYRCEPLSMWNMAFPLHIESQVVGVLFGGQIILSDVTINWREALQKYIKYIDWSTCPDQDNQIQTIFKKISSYDISAKQKDVLFDILTKQKNTISINDFQKRIEDFLRFGYNTQELLDELHKAKNATAEQLFLRNYDENLFNIDLADSNLWWKECGQVLHSLIQLPKIDDVCLYARYHSRYLLKVPWSNDVSTPDQLPTREVISAFPPEELVAISDVVNKNFTAFTKLGQSNVWGYRSQTGTGSEECSTLVVFQGEIVERRSFLANLCKVICTATDSTQLIFRDREAEGNYRLKVNLIGHSFRTPLQALYLELEELEKAPSIASSLILKEKVKNCMARIKDASEDLLLLLEPTEQNRTTFDLITVLNYVLKTMEPIAKKHPCDIIKQGEWSTSVTVQGNPYRVQRAITCLVDNAIKYSYYGHRQKLGELFQVSVRVHVENNYVKITLANYGVGIPPDKLTHIREYGFRGDLVDKKKTRLGTGLGLPFAIDVFEDLGGWLHLTSVPTGSITKEENKAFHRYITTVEATLPVIKRK
jgi:signal transduction histidine kinase/ligand-binding sensor protein